MIDYEKIKISNEDLESVPEQNYLSSNFSIESESCSCTNSRTADSTVTTSMFESIVNKKWFYPSIAVSFILVVLFALVVSDSSSYSAAIEKVLSLDYKAGVVHAQYSSPSEGIRARVAAMETIDLRNCPSDFRRAYLIHTQAWSDAIVFVDKYQGGEGALIAFLEGLVSGQNIPAQQQNQVANAISDTWMGVIDMAIKYGVHPGDIK